MLKKYRFQSFSLIFVGIAFLASGCVSGIENSNESGSEYIDIVLIQDDYELVTSEDPAFRTFLNNSNGSDDVDVPVPQWNSLDFELTSLLMFA